MSLEPAKRPVRSLAQVLKHLADARVKDAVALIGIRGFREFADLGRPGRNDRGIYDDAIFLVGPSHFSAYNANTDPSIARPRVAVLKAGLWRYKIGIHGLSRPAEQRYRALVQAAEVTVLRDEAGPDTGWFGINIHRGSRGSTSSLGCQTIWPDQWTAFLAAVEDQLRRAGQKEIPYLLLQEA